MRFINEGSKIFSRGFLKNIKVAKYFYKTQISKISHIKGDKTRKYFNIKYLEKTPGFFLA